LKEHMRAQKLEDLYDRIVKDEDFLDETIFGISGVDLKDKNQDNELRGKVDTVRILVKGKDPDLMQREMNFIRNSIRGLSQYLSVKRFLDDMSREAKLKLFNTEAQVMGVLNELIQKKYLSIRQGRISFSQYFLNQVLHG